MVGVLCYYLYCVYNKHSTLIEYPFRTPNISTGQIIRLILRSRGSLEVLYIYIEMGTCTYVLKSVFIFAQYTFVSKLVDI